MGVVSSSYKVDTIKCVRKREREICVCVCVCDHDSVIQQRLSGCIRKREKEGSCVHDNITIIINCVQKRERRRIRNLLYCNIRKREEKEMK